MIGGVGGTGALGGLLGGTGGSAGGFLSGGTASGGSASGGLGGLFGGGTAGGGTPNAPDAGAEMDAGTASDSGTSLDGGNPDAAPDGSHTRPDGAIGASGDAGLCSTGSSARVDGGCQGSYCNMTLTTLADSTRPGSCIDEPTLRLACDARLSHKTAQCAQENALSLSLGGAVRSCLRRDPQLSFVDNSCVDCYVAELTCTLSNCLAVCVIGLDVECTSCRRASCGAEFARCSGLPGL